MIFGISTLKVRIYKELSIALELKVNSESKEVKLISFKDVLLLCLHRSSMTFYQNHVYSDSSVLCRNNVPLQDYCA